MTVEPGCSVYVFGIQEHKKAKTKSAHKSPAAAGMAAEIKTELSAEETRKAETDAAACFQSMAAERAMRTDGTPRGSETWLTAGMQLRVRCVSIAELLPRLRSLDPIDETPIATP